LILEETHAHFVAVEPDALAAPVRAAGRRQHEKELTRIDAFGRSLDLELRARIGDVADPPVALPSPVDPHDSGRITAPEMHAVEMPTLTDHRNSLDNELNRGLLPC